MLSPFASPLKKPHGVLAIFLGLYVLIWTFAPALLAQSVALDVSEGVNWGREWQWGYYKHPPLSSWVLYSFYRILGDVGIYLLSQLCIFGSLYLIYQLGKQFFSKNLALLGALLVLMVGYYSYPALEFNHNVAQLPIWAGLLYSFYLAVNKEPDNSQSDGKWSHWLIFGVLGGLGMLTKYHVIFLLTSMAIYLLLPANRHWLKSPKPWAAALVMLAVFSPHLLWLVQNHWLPFSYAESRIATKSALAGHVSWLGFLGSQALVHLPLLIATLWVVKKTPKTPLSPIKLSITLQQWQHSPYFYLVFMTVMPVVLVVSCSLILGMGLRDMWGMPMWGLSGLLTVAWLNGRLSEENWQVAIPKFDSAIKIWLTLITAVMIVIVGFSHKFAKNPSRMQYPQAAIATKTAQTWQNLSTCPLDNLAGDRWYTALAAMRLPNFPSLIIGGDMAISPWITPQRLHEHGTMIIQENLSQDKNTQEKANAAKSGEIAPLGVPALEQTLNADPNLKQFQGEWQIPWQLISKKSPLRLQWTAYVPVSCIPSNH